MALGTSANARCVVTNATRRVSSNNIITGSAERVRSARYSVMATELKARVP